MLKICRICKKNLDKSLFNKKTKSLDGLQYACKKCHNNINKQNKYYLRYGLTYKQSRQILKQQDYKCKICNLKIRKNGQLDHCHKTNKVRGYLCKHCNWGLGHFKDDINILNSAVTYLQKIV